MEKKKRKEGEKRKEKREKKMEDFSAFGRSKLNGLSTKVGPRITIHVWIPKTWSFGKFHGVGNFPTQFTFSLKAI